MLWNIVFEQCFVICTKLPLKLLITDREKPHFYITTVNIIIIYYKVILFRKAFFFYIYQENVKIRTVCAIYGGEPKVF